MKPKPYSDKEIKYQRKRIEQIEASGDHMGVYWHQMRLHANIADLNDRRTADAERFKGYIDEWGERLRKAKKRIEELEKINKVHRDLRPDETGVLKIIELKEETIRAEATIERLRGALEKIVEKERWGWRPVHGKDWDNVGSALETIGFIAHNALNEKE
jgi:DNA repair exonuclease SbcCD ATPase subunit